MEIEVGAKMKGWGLTDADLEVLLVELNIYNELQHLLKL
jgi:hypothetical protein